MDQVAFTLPSFAKINLHLQVVGKRSDGYHDICTVFQTVSLHDNINFAPSERVTLTCDIATIPVDEVNLIVRAARALQTRFGIRRGAKIDLNKRIPAPGGLGGGSSNAAVALLGLVKLWNLRICSADLQKLAAEIGADVPFFLCGGTALGLGIGSDLFPLSDFDAKYLLIVTPDVPVSTCEVFSGLKADSLTTEASNRILQICRFEAESRDLHRASLRNDLEKVTFEKYPEVEEVKKTLVQLGARHALMTGSGASVFGIL